MTFYILEGSWQIIRGLGMVLPLMQLNITVGLQIAVGSCGGGLVWLCVDGV